ncbi:MAG: hypothetical protein OEV74_06750 [Cyclobacteriaceae bacterium]|nr:hypothetical protein [Cyclobacteriaceae bacterium]
MDSKGTESDLIAYLYGELEGKEKESFEQYLLDNPEAREELEKFKQLRSVMGNVKDKEVIAPPIFVGDHHQRFWNAPYFKTVVSIAASLLVIMLVGKFIGMKVKYSDNQLSMSFGSIVEPYIEARQTIPALTSAQVQEMINTSLNQNNIAMQASWSETQEKLDASVKSNLALNSAKIDNLVRESSAASQEQIQQFVSGLQTENMQLVKNYFQLTSNEQKQYIESLLVDFAKYLQQQRNDDLQVVQTKLNSLEQNTDVFKQETEQILTSIISTVGNKKSLGTRN